jgi:excisionase family DNA binding protein
MQREPVQEPNMIGYADSEMTDSSEDTTLTLKEAAALLRVSYSTVYAHREKLGFFQVGSTWRVWRSRLTSMGGKSGSAHIKKTAKAPTTDENKSGEIASWIDGMTPKQIEEEFERLVNPLKKSRTPTR